MCSSKSSFSSFSLSSFSCPQPSWVSLLSSFTPINRPYVSRIVPTLILTLIVRGELCGFGSSTSSPCVMCISGYCSLFLLVQADHAAAPLPFFLWADHITASAPRQLFDELSSSLSPSLAFFPLPVK